VELALAPLLRPLAPEHRPQVVVARDGIGGGGAGCAAAFRSRGRPPVPESPVVSSQNPHTRAAASPLRPEIIHRH
jgi:succinate dehydrogenase/fumarate reductase flavoprotein subunit